MSTALAAAIASLLSLPPLFWLAWCDPKRLRSLRRRPAPQRRSRGVLASALLVPGLALALGGLWPAFLIWFGGVFVAGWLLTLLLASLSGGGVTANVQGRAEHSGGA